MHSFVCKQETCGRKSPARHVRARGVSSACWLRLQAGQQQQSQKHWARPTESGRGSDSLEAKSDLGNLNTSDLLMKFSQEKSVREQTTQLGQDVGFRKS